MKRQVAERKGLFAGKGVEADSENKQPAAMHKKNSHM